MSFTAPHPSFSTRVPAPAAPAARHRAPRALAAAAAAALVAAGGYAAARLAHEDGSGSPTSAPRLRDQVLATSSIPGLAAATSPVVVHSPQAWTGLPAATVPSQPAGQLRALGFTGGVVGRLHSPGAEWTSIAERYRSSAGAQREARYVYTHLRRAGGAAVTRFAVSGVPGAQGLSIAGPRTTRVATVFAAGRSVYLVSAASSRSAAPVAMSPQVAAAAGWLYLALHGCVTSLHHGHAGAPPVPVLRAHGRI
jgi:hypothetical protein